MARFTWDKPRILTMLRQLHGAGRDISYNALAKSKQSLVSAAAYHFGSYREAIASAGINYSQVVRRPRWTKQAIIRLVKAAKKRGEDLRWSAVSRRRDELGLAAFASLQGRLFGRWDRALHASGLDADDICQYRRWNPSTIIYEIKCIAREKDPLNSGAIQRDDPGLHAAAVRHFGSYDDALAAAGLDPAAFRQRRRWSKAEVLRELRALERNGVIPSSAEIRRQHSSLYGAATRLFGACENARKAALSSMRTADAPRSRRK